MTLSKREAKKLYREAFADAERDIIAKHKAGEFDDGDPNHPQYNNGFNYTQCFGMTWDALFSRQMRK